MVQRHLPVGVGLANELAHSVASVAGPIAELILLTDHVQFIPGVGPVPFMILHADQPIQVSPPNPDFTWRGGWDSLKIVIGIASISSMAGLTAFREASAGLLTLR